MKTPLILFLFSLILCAAGLILRAWSDLLLLGVPCAFASLWLLWRKWRKAKWIIVDGSNVMYWRDQTPRIEPLRDVIRELQAKKYIVGVMFDANAGYLLRNEYLHHRAMSKLVKLPAAQVMVVPKGKPADPFILKAARDYGARIVSNDKFRDWVDDFPEVANGGNLVKGCYRTGVLELELT
ncbi:NYN domain-containing protein [Planktotalea sp.]|uniref:NYN domain-containing protein n=1 Tax=Planktotalea sp. TaxID=2029877 RepID=UPI003F6B8665